MYVIVVPADDCNIDSKNLYFVENRYSLVWTTIVYHGKIYYTREEAEKVIKEHNMKGVSIEAL